MLMSVVFKKIIDQLMDLVDLGWYWQVFVVCYGVGICFGIVIEDKWYLFGYLMVVFISNVIVDKVVCVVFNFSRKFLFE